jgi:hypothetical protein
VGSCFVAIGLAAGCGKKGPPLAPLVPIPAAVDQLSVVRLGDQVYVSLTLPAANVDAFEPADLARVEIYGYTGRTAPPRGRFVEFATLVGSVPVAPAPPAPLEAGKQPPEDASPPPPPDAPKQGAQVTVLDALTPDELVQGRTPPPAARTPPSADEGKQSGGDPEVTERAPAPLKRFYVAVPFSRRGRPGPPGSVGELVLTPVPDPSPEVHAAYTARAVLLSWEPAGGLLGYLLEQSLPEEPLPFPIDEEDEATAAPEAEGPLTYHVYREFLADPSTPPGPGERPWDAVPATPITGIPVASLEFADTPAFGRRACYTVRAVRGAGPAARIGAASPEACVTPVDVFAPAAPQGVVTVASDGAISLLWEPVAAADLAGYIVLRGEAPGDTLRPLTSAPVAEPGFRDASVEPGTRYVYAVVAVDNRIPVPNVSPASATVEETAR